MKRSECRRARGVLFSAGLLTGACLLLQPNPARALPRPLSPEELEKQSDVVAGVRVLAVTCVAQEPDKANKQTLSTYQAWLQIVSVKKGEVKENETVLVTWKEIPKGPIGAAPPVVYLPGEEVMTHLKWDEKQRLYTSTYYNAKGTPTKPADGKLPEKVGEVSTARAQAGKAPEPAKD
jgi:hypothetical protein